jgi:ribosomal protein S18 acetylase RimI-like enzyme
VRQPVRARPEVVAKIGMHADGRQRTTSMPATGAERMTIDLEAPLRRATEGDAPVLAELVNMAGEGLPLYLWGKMAEGGESAWDVGRRRARREAGSFSYRNAVVAEVDGRVIAGLIGYALPDRPAPIDHQMPAMFVPLQELENLAPGTWYVNVLATLGEYRGRGHGTRLLGVAERLATAAGCSGLSIVVADANAGARRLYERCGYVERAMRAMVKEAWNNPGENWVLLVKRLP